VLVLAAGPDDPAAAVAVAFKSATAAGTVTDAEGQKVEGQQCPATVNAASKQLRAGHGGLCAGHGPGPSPALWMPSPLDPPLPRPAGTRAAAVPVLHVLSALLLMLAVAAMLLLLLLL